VAVVAGAVVVIVGRCWWLGRKKNITKIKETLVSNEKKKNE
jgi:hypothetical protein